MNPYRIALRKAVEAVHHSPAIIVDRIDVLDLAKMVIRMTDSASRIAFLPLPQDDPVQRRPDITLAWEKIFWKPRVPLEEGLEKTIAYFKRVL